METNNSAKSGGMGVGTLLTIVFVVLKLCGVIGWSWFWVLSPVIFSTIFTLIFIVVAAIIVTHRRKNNKWWD